MWAASIEQVQAGEVVLTLLTAIFTTPVKTMGVPSSAILPQPQDVTPWAKIGAPIAPNTITAYLTPFGATPP